MADELVHLERRDDGVAVVTLDNPKVNALSGSAAPAAAEPRRGAPADPPGAVVVTGGERIFAAGADITRVRRRRRGGRHRRQLPRGPGGRGRHPPPGHRRRGRLRPRRRVRAGAGLRLPDRRPSGPCSVSRRSCSASSRAAAARSGCARLVGPARAKDLILTGRQVKADEALPHRPVRRGRGAARRCTSGPWPSPASWPRARSPPRRWPSGPSTSASTSACPRRLALERDAVRRRLPHRGQPDRREELPRARPGQGRVHRAVARRRGRPLESAAIRPGSRRR